jgi:hypothetical protein
MYSISKLQMFKEKTGRKAGEPNKVTAKVRDAFALLLENNLDSLQSDIDDLKPNERIKVLLDLATFIIPKMRSVEVSQQEQEQLKPIVFTFDFQNDND